MNFTSQTYSPFFMKKSSVEQITPLVPANFLALVDLPDPGTPRMRTMVLSGACYSFSMYQCEQVRIKQLVKEFLVQIQDEQDCKILNKSDQCIKMIRATNTIISWIKKCPVLMVKPHGSSMNPLPWQYLKQSKTLTTLDRSILFTSKYCMAKKKQDKDEKKKKEKTKIKQQIGGDVTEIDLNKYEEPYKRVIQNYKVFLAKCRAGKLDAATFDDIQVKVGKDKLQIKQLAQIAPKTTTSVIINPYDSDNLDAIQKSIKSFDDSFETLKIQKALSVSLPNSSIQEMKKKMVDKVKKSLNDQKDLLKKQRHVCHQDLKKYEKIAQKDQLKQIEKEAKELFDKYNEMLQKMTKQKEKQLMK